MKFCILRLSVTAALAVMKKNAEAIPMSYQNDEDEDIAPNKSMNDSHNPAVLGNASRAAIAEKVAPVLNTPIQSIHWTKVIELCYSLPDSTTTTTTTVTSSSSSNSNNSKRPICFSCEKQEDNLSFMYCGQCRVAKYCGRECQTLDWKLRHKRACASYQRMIYTKLPYESSYNEIHSELPVTHYKKIWSLRSDDFKCEVRNDFFGKIRFYVCPYAVVRYNELGRGFIFLQTNHTLEIASLLIPIDCDGYRIPTRSCSVHYLTSGEYDQEVCRDDFEMTTVRSELQDAIAQYDPTKQIVVLMRFRCGHLALGTTTLVPDYQLCQHLGRDYYDQSTGAPIGSLQLNLDE
jgi:hypothetical protein